MFRMTAPQSSVLLGVAVLAVVVVSLLLSFARKKGAQRYYLLFIVATMVLGLGYLFFYAPSRVAVSLTEDELEVAIPPFVKESWAYGDISRAFVADWTTAEHEGLRPAQRTMGTAVGEYRTGRFTLVNGQKALLMVNGSRFICLETPDETLILAPDDLEGFRAALERKLGFEIQKN